MAEEIKEIIIKPTGFYRRTIYDEPIDANPAIENLISNSGSVVQNLAVGEGLIHMKSNRGEVCIAQRMKKVPLRMRFSPTLADPVFMYPSTQPGSVMLSLVWVPPDDIMVWFVSRIMVHETTCFLVVTKVGGQGLWKLPLPNLYGDARICMGDASKAEFRQYETTPEFNLIGCHGMLLHHLRTSEWNSDLEAAIESSQATFRFDLNGQQIPPATDWMNHLASVSNPSYNWLTSVSQPES